jgi:predicted regulator of Ras-like GTPase activity (Roadblock/LC7/MglB family)
MSLKETLNSIIDSVDGAMAAIIFAGDGVSIDEIVAERADLDTQLLAVEYATILKEIRRAVDVIRMGTLEELSLTTTGSCCIVRVLNDEIYTALILSGDGNIGKGRYVLKVKSFEIQRELS